MRFSAQFLPIKKNTIFLVDLSVKSIITDYTPKSAGNCYAHKVSHKCSSNYYDFLISLLLSLKTGCLSLIFFSLSNDSCYWYVMTNTSIR